VTAADIEFIAKTGSLEVASAGWQVLAWVIVGFFAVAYVALIVLTTVRRPRPQRPAPCPCCTGEPYKVDDCTCREDCGVRWCQAADPEVCPWCDTHECIDRTKCNCAAACGSWLCEAKEASRG
jgi:hypothetical protein